MLNNFVLQLLRVNTRPITRFCPLFLYSTLICKLKVAFQCKVILCLSRKHGNSIVHYMQRQLQGVRTMPYRATRKAVTTSCCHAWITIGCQLPLLQVAAFGALQPVHSTSVVIVGCYSLMWPSRHKQSTFTAGLEHIGGCTVMIKVTARGTWKRVL